MAVPTWTFFFFLGTCVFVFYQVFPDAKVRELGADQVFPSCIGCLSGGTSVCMPTG